MSKKYNTCMASSLPNTTRRNKAYTIANTEFVFLNLTCTGAATSELKSEFLIAVYIAHYVRGHF